MRILFTWVALVAAIGCGGSGGDMTGPDLLSATMDMRADLAGADLNVSNDAATAQDLSEFTDLGTIASASTIAAAPSDNVIANGFSVSTITVVVVDPSGASVAGKTIALTSTGTHNTIHQPTLTTDEAGYATGTIASNSAESKTIGATIDGVAMSQTATVYFVSGAPNAINSTLTTNPAAVPVNGTATVTVTVLDERGNPIAGQAVSLSSDGSQFTFVPPTGVSDASGNFTATITAPTLGKQDLTATIGSGANALTVTGAVVFGCGGETDYSTQINTMAGYPIETTRGYSIARGDFNGDGVIDLIASMSGPQNYYDPIQQMGESLSPNGFVTPFFGNGDGTFAQNGTFTTESVNSVVATGDFNGDTFDDFVVGGNSANLTVYLSNGDGTFAPGVDYPDNAGPTYQITAADFNGDHILDLVVTQLGGIEILLGGAHGTFGTATLISNNASQFVVGNFDADQHLDIAMLLSGDGTISGSVTILKGVGNGTFTTQGSFDAGLYPQSITSGDLNGDTFVDLIVGNTGDYSSDTPPTVSVLLGVGDGTFLAHADYATGFYPTTLAIGDFNGDTHLDVVAGNFGEYQYSDGVSYLLGNGNGTLQANLDYLTNASTGIVTGNFNADAYTDVASVDSIDDGPQDITVLLDIPAPLCAQ